MDDEGRGLELDERQTKDAMRHAGKVAQSLTALEQIAEDAAAAISELAERPETPPLGTEALESLDHGRVALQTKLDQHRALRREVGELIVDLEMHYRTFAPDALLLTSVEPRIREKASRPLHGLVLTFPQIARVGTETLRWRDKRTRAWMQIGRESAQPLALMLETTPARELAPTLRSFFGCDE